MTANSKEQLQGAFGGLRDIVAEHLTTGQQHGFVRPGLHPEETAGWITWMAERGLHQLVAEADPAHTDRLIEGLADVIWFTAYEGQGREDDIGR